MASSISVIPSATYVVDLPPQIEESVVIPLELLAVAQCESGGRQYDKDGNVVRGKINSLDTGKWQVNIYHWGKDAKKLGYDLETEEGNTKMALWIYKNYGLTPWRWSRWCWQPKVDALKKI